MDREEFHLTARVEKLHSGCGVLVDISLEVDDGADGRLVTDLAEVPGLNWPMKGLKGLIYVFLVDVIVHM